MSKRKCFIFKGKQSFSRSKLEQINHEFNKSNNLNTEISSNEIYFVLTDSSKIDVDALKDVLSASENNQDFSFYVGPRLGTISPWSSKTEDIIRNVGFKNILRVEKLFGYLIDSKISNQNLNTSMFICLLYTSPSPRDS